MSFCLYSCFFFFFLLIRPPLRSTLFPYTTLFRSRLGPVTEYVPKPLMFLPGGSLIDFHVQRLNDIKVSAIHVEIKDRKSTRLNSSHRTISYAVFCLKKKKKKTKQTITKTNKNKTQ